jgi:hypothetical protein
VNASKLGPGDSIAALAGAVLVVVMFLPWYGVDVQVANLSISESGNAWEALSFIDILLFGVAAVAIGVPVARATGSLPADVPGPLLVLAAGSLGVLLVLFRIVDIPAPDIPAVAADGVDFGRKIGIFLALIATGGIAYGGWRSNMERPGAPAASSAPVAPPPETTAAG